MINLVLKDMLIQKRTFIICIFYSIFAVVVFSSAFQSGGAYIFGVIGIVYMFTFYSNSYDDKNKCEMVLNSLPVNRKDIVTAKYLSVIVFTVIGVIYMVFAAFLLNSLALPISVQNINTSDIVMSIASAALMYSIFYPLYFKYGLTKLKMLNTILYLAFAFGPSMLLPYIKSSNSEFIRWISIIVNSSPGCIPEILLFAAAFLIILLSINISTYLYNQRDI